VQLVGELLGRRGEMIWAVSWWPVGIVAVLYSSSA
jgi:hypothetical protein